MWDEKILKCLNSNINGGRGVTNYVKITSTQLVGVYLTIFVREELIRNGSIRERPISTTTVATGFSLGFRNGSMNVKLGNKGGCCALIKIRDTSIAFICAHLAAGSKDEDTREGMRTRRRFCKVRIRSRCFEEDEQGEDDRDFRHNNIRWEKPRELEPYTMRRFRYSLEI